MKLTIIYVYRNRDVERVKRSLDSLADQSNKNFTVLFIDYGSLEKYKDPIQKLVNSYTFCKYIYNFTTGMPWNRAHALNTGIKLATTEFIFTADVDMIFKFNFVDELYNSMQPESAVFFSVYFLSRDFNEWNNPDKGIAGHSDTDALGLALIPKKKIQRVNGYDEFFTFWGFEDNDMRKRLSATGVNTYFHGKDVLMYHQWHEIVKNDYKNMPETWGAFQREYYLDKGRDYNLVNEAGWGKLYENKDRPAFHLYENNACKFISSDFLLDYSIYLLVKQILHVTSGDSVCFEFKDTHSGTHINSRLGKMVNGLNRILVKFSFPVKLYSRFKVNYTTAYEFRDRLIYTLILLKPFIKDYYLEESNNIIRIVIVKN